MSSDLEKNKEPDSRADTVKILKECNAGVKMGVDSIAEVLEHIQSPHLKKVLAGNQKAHQQLGSEVHRLLNQLDESGKEPNPVAKGMSWMKTNMMMAMDESDSTVADLITDGCNMGVKSLNRYLNQYRAADSKSKDITKQLIGLEEQLAADLRSYL